MTGSKEGHRRYKTSRELSRLLGGEIEVKYTQGNEILRTEKGVLESRTKRESENPGFYIGNTQLPLRSIRGINYVLSKIVVAQDYLERYKARRAA